MTERITSQALYMQVADRLREQIYQHELTPGDAIDEMALCERFGISRTPLREALKVLNSEGLIELIPRRGSFVRSMDIEELNELFPVMVVLEGLCAREAVENCAAQDLQQLDKMHEKLESLAGQGDIDGYYEQNFVFHQAVQDLSGNKWLQRVIGDLRKVLRLARHMQLTMPGRLEASLEEHRQIMQAFIKNDPDMADRNMQNHLKQQWFSLVDKNKSNTRVKNK
ncbi:MAG: GntR family transcriptional regulator [Gammaproteobacteria bacterium]|nr:GntR family transcriptional regulator [Gammaproteobacteria bacterium]